jgi:hypothetical protein
MKTLITFMICIVLFSCNKLETKKNKSSLQKKNKEILEDKMKVIDSTVLNIEIINNQFANQPLGDYNFDSENLFLYFKGSYDVHKEPVQNEFSSNIDTLITFQKKNSFVKFHKTNEKVLFDSMNVTDKNFVIFSLGVDIDMDKDQFLEKFKVTKKESFSDTILIVDDEGSTSVKVIFTNNKLKNIIILPW